MAGDRCALSNGTISRDVCGCAIVPEIRNRERRCMLESSRAAVTSRRREWIIGAVHRSGECEWRETIASAKRRERRLITHAVVDAEVDVTSIDSIDLEAIVETDRSALAHLARERKTRAEPLVDVNAGRTAAMSEHAEA